MNLICTEDTFLYELDWMNSTYSSPSSASSIFFVTSSSTSSADAPKYIVEIKTFPISTEGIFSTGMVRMLNTPATTRITKTTLINTVCLMENLTTDFIFQLRSGNYGGYFCSELQACQQFLYIPDSNSFCGSISFQPVAA